MTATYFKHGEGRSINARVAEEEGKMPLTRAVKFLAAQRGITLKDARSVLLLLGPCEWHHVGKFASECSYYDVFAAVDYLDALPLLGRLPLLWRDEVTNSFASIHGTPIGGEARDAKIAEFSAICGLPSDVLLDYYYSLPRGIFCKD